jgi:hypothetical protein
MTTPRALASANFARYIDGLVADAPVPPAEVLSRAITPADVAAYPVYFIHGPGQDLAHATDCGHGYTLLDSCPCCDSNEGAAS